MKKNLIILLLFILSMSSSAQFHQKSNYSGVGVPYFDVEMFRTFTHDGTGNHIIFYSEILYDDLTFVKGENNDYLAKIEFVIAVFKNEDEQVFSKNTIEEIKEVDYNATNSREKKFNLTNEFDLPAGEYEVKMQANDLTSHKTINKKINLNLKDFATDSLVLSDILLLENIETDSMGNVLNIKPRIKNNFPGRIGFFYIYFDLYSAEIPNTIDVQYQFIGVDDEVEIDSVITRQVNKHVTGCYVKIDKKKLLRNRYSIVIKAENNGKTIEQKKMVSFYWITTPETSEDITLALRQMRYIVSEDSLDKYMESSLDSQKVFFRNYWSRRDPNPNTPVNELMEEYFKRVNFSNKEYSTFKDNGWLTDRGRILIKFGYPDDIERHPFELHTNPYVVWRYYTLRKIFVFSDRTGFGDYQLLPGYYDQEWR